VRFWQEKHARKCFGKKWWIRWLRWVRTGRHTKKTAGLSLPTLRPLPQAAPPEPVSPRTEPRGTDGEAAVGGATGRRASGRHSNHRARQPGQNTIVRKKHMHDRQAATSLPQQVSIVMIGEKRCTNCGICLAASCFYKRPGRPIGLQSACITCVLERKRQRYADNPRAVLEYQRSRRVFRRAANHQ
jgi:ferredoxin